MAYSGAIPPGKPHPKGGNWAAAPKSRPLNCPPGLEYLSMVDQLLVHQQVERLEAITGFETENKYWIRNSLGQDVYYAKEESGACSRNFFGSKRPFEMKIFDNLKKEVIHIKRPLAFCFPKMEVYAPPGNLLGTIEKESSIFSATFAVKNANEETVLRIEGSCWTASFSDVDFRITTVRKSDVGKITKQWSGLMREACTDADNFKITFPIDMDVKMKAVLLGGLFLIDMTCFEKSSKK